jgi:hypothetical protein
MPCHTENQLLSHHRQQQQQQAPLNAVLWSAFDNASSALEPIAVTPPGVLAASGGIVDRGDEETNTTKTKLIQIINSVLDLVDDDDL